MAAHHDEQSRSALDRALEILREHGLVAMASAMQTRMNEAMKLERSEFLRVAMGARESDGKRILLGVSVSLSRARGALASVSRAAVQARARGGDAEHE
jgi:hypothetical protein